jgi:hypothetical protein
MVVLACADAWNAGESAPALADDAVRRALAPAGAAPGLRWSAVCQALAPLPLPETTTVFEPGLAGLCERRLMSGSEGRLLPDPRLSVLLRSLSPPTAFAALQTIHRATDSAVAAGFAAVRTPSALWLLEAAEDTAWGPADPGARVRLFQVTGRQLRAAIEAMIGAETRLG